MFKKISNIFAGDSQKRRLDKLVTVVDQINALEPTFEALSNDALRAKTDEFRQRLSQGETLDDLLPEAFAAVREASKRTLGLRHYDVQLICGINLHQGNISELRTGEGKTLAATLPLYLNALEGKGAHLVTVNDYLARRDARWMGPIYDLLGLRVGVLQMSTSADAKWLTSTIQTSTPCARRPTCCGQCAARKLTSLISPMAPTPSLVSTICAITSP